MWQILAVIGGALGTAAAFAIHALFGWVRRCLPVPTAVIGWLLAGAAAFFAALLTRVYLGMRSNPRASMAPFWGFLALILGVLLLVCGGIGLIHQRALRMSWVGAFGVLIAEVGAAVLAALFLYEIRYSLADVLRGGGRGVDRILDSFAQADNLLFFFDLSLIAALLLLESIAPLLRWRTAFPE